MAQHQRPDKTSNEKADQRHRLGPRGSEPLLEQLQDRGLPSLAETPFYPSMVEHAAAMAEGPPGQSLADFVRQLQRAYGNRYVQRLVESVGVQARLTVSDPHDIYEQEADRVAEEVVRAVNSPTQRQEEEEELQAKPVSGIQRQEEEEELQAKTASEDLEARINSACGNGQHLSASIREPMEKAFGADFSGVRTHTGPEADVLNKQLTARAFTTGQHIFFRQGEYSPGSESGQRLIAHELTHVVQQHATRVCRRQAGKQISWAASEAAQAISEPQEISWGASRELADAGRVPSVISASAPTTLDAIQTAEGKDTWAVAPFPTGYKAPNFDVNATEKKGDGGASQWFANPTLTERAFEGNSQPVHPRPGLYKQPQAEPESKVPVFVDISAPMSRLLGVAEDEHARDYKWAYTISLKAAQSALNKGVIGKSFGPKPTKGEAEQMVIDNLARYIHANAGNDKTKWADMYRDLYLKTLVRDKAPNEWHTLPYGNRREIKDADGAVTKVIYDVVRGPTTKIGVVPPARIIKY